MNNRDKAAKRAGAASKKARVEIDKKDLLTSLRQLHRIKLLDGGFAYTEYRYARGASSGRLFIKGAGLQNLARPARHYLCAGFFRDWDMVSCHHAILLQLCGRHGIPCPKLAKYVENPKAFREKVRDALGCDYDTAKEFLIGLTYGAAPKLEGVP
ncbi:hypothetical protein JKP88DRAFT_165223, partial [Tribonema minus]